MRASAAILVCASLLTTQAAVAAPLSDWHIKPAGLDLGAGWTVRLGGTANLTAYTAQQNGLSDRQGVTASIFLHPRIEKLFANGWRVGLRSSLNAYHDALSGDNYGNDFVEKLYLFLAAPWGRVELGQQDGAAYKMSITGPLVDEEAALDDPDITFFRDPVTGKALIDTYEVRSGVFATSNAAKISYYTPRLFGVRIGVSYTPHLVKEVLPFVATRPHLANRQDNIVETAINYTGYFGNTAIGAYAGLAAGHNTNATPGHDDLLDWGIGAELDYDFAGTVLAVGGAWHQTNGYGFEADDVVSHGTSRAVHASTTLSHGDWKVGFEYLKGVNDAAIALPKRALSGYQVNAGYEINANLELTAGWQHQRLTQSSGSFYNGARALDLDAGYLHLRIHV
jgi:outer membrane protein OmpU